MKSCSKCKAKKSLSDFYKNCKAIDKKQSECKKCHGKYSKGGNLRKTDYAPRLRELDKEYQRKKRAENPKAKSKESLEWKKKNPEKYSAHKKVWWAVKTGKLVRGKCRDCDLTNVQGHHPDYSKPLEVIWLCPSHHKLEDLKAKV